MDLSKLTRHYELLSPWERLPLIVAAGVRGDDSERERLIGSAPKYAFRVPDHWGLAQGVDRLVMVHIAMQLDLAASYWHLSAALAELSFGRCRRAARQRQDRLLNLLRLTAYRLVTYAEAWKLLTADLQIDAEDLLRDVPGYDNVRLAEQAASCMAYSEREALEYLRGLVKEKEPTAAADATRPIHVETAAEVATFMRQYLETTLDEWS
jgi:hypothetical protein